MAKNSAKKSAPKPRKKPARKLAGKPAKKSAQKSAPKKATPPANIWYGLIVNGSRIPMNLPSIKDAEAPVSGLKQQGCELAVYDQDSGKIVKRL